MALVPWRKNYGWSPMHEIEALHREMNRLFGSSLSKLDDTDDNPVITVNWNPSIDVQDKKDKYIVKAEVPGMEKEDIKISIEDSVLTIKGDKKLETEKEEDGRFYRECSYGSFQRSLRLGDDVDTEAVDASYKNGVLKLDIPKKAPEKTKSAEIKIK